MTTACPFCDATGREGDATCGVCGGTGRVPLLALPPEFMLLIADPHALDHLKVLNIDTVHYGYEHGFQ